MPELPEVEITRRGIAPHLSGRRIRRVHVREPRLRWPVPETVGRAAGQSVKLVFRRAKYLILTLETGSLIIHLGMSGSLRLVREDTRPGPHDHFDLVLDGGEALRYNDPRRFGCLLWTDADPLTHPLLSKLGPEPLGEEFSGDVLYRRSRGRRVAIKPFLMDAHTVVGVGNIYASEALYRAKIHPDRPAGRIGRKPYDRLADAVRAVLGDAIAAGGTTLRDFTGADGRPGYFARSLSVYGREGEPCPRCGTAISLTRNGQRATYHCPRCQPARRAAINGQVG